MLKHRVILLYIAVLSLSITTYMQAINIAEEGYLEELQTPEPTQGPITTLQFLGTFEHRLPGIRERYTSGTLTDEDRQSIESSLQSIEQARLRQIRIRMGYELDVEAERERRLQEIERQRLEAQREAERRNIVRGIAIFVIAILAVLIIKGFKANKTHRKSETDEEIIL